MIQAVIFNLDGVIAATHVCHYKAWETMAYEQGIPFDLNTYRQMAGMKRMDSLRVLLKRAERAYAPGEMWAQSARKNDLFNESVYHMGVNALLPGVKDTIKALREEGIRTAIASCSENAPGILRQLKLLPLLDAVVDGSELNAGKPDPEVFLLAARKLSMPTGDCLVIENTQAGITAAQEAGMKVIALDEEETGDRECPLKYQSLTELDLPAWILDGRGLEGTDGKNQGSEG